MKTQFLLIAFLMISAGCQQQSGDTGTVARPRTTVQKELGQQLFLQHCAPCHGKQANGGTVGPDLTASRYKYGKSRDSIIKTITEGRAGGMPAFGSHLKAEEIEALADYLLTKSNQ